MNASRGRHCTVAALDVGSAAVAAAVAAARSEDTDCCEAVDRSSPRDA